MNKLSNEKRKMIIGGLVEGVGINAISRMVGVSKNTVLKLITDLGTACANYQDEKFRNLKLTNIQCDEIWSFCHSKVKNVPEEKRGLLGSGDLWTWVAMDSETKLVPLLLRWT